MLGDRVRAVGTVWLGQTIGCCQCHDHKYDPLTMRDFYSMGAFFADIDEPILGRREPGMLLLDEGQADALAQLTAAVERCSALLDQENAELDAAQARAPTGTARLVLLDGSRQLWNYVDKNPRFDHYHKCIDFWHAVEHLSVAAEALFTKDGDDAKDWYEKYRRILQESDDGAARICRSIDYYAKRLHLSKTRRVQLREQRTYFKRNGKRMHYATVRTNGWPIGSGPIEAACKTLVKTRLCRSGMRWSRPGGQRILALRTYVKSNRWDSAWQHIKELERAA
jgi:hypothetical protein